MSPAAVQTYRYLRIGLVGAVVLLAISILIERSEVDCWQTSISGYYYTPVRAIFVGMLITIGFALIVIKGRTTSIDVALNFAGMLAPLVAVAPTTNVGTCWSVDPPAAPVNPDGTLAGWVVANIDNNVGALILTGIVGLVAWLVIVAATGGLGAILQAGSTSLRLGLVATAAFIVVVWAAFRFWDDFDERAHGLAAVTLFVFLAVAVLLNAGAVRGVPGKQVFFVLYLGIFVAMIVAAIPLLFSGWEYNVLFVEAVEIVLFAVFWAVQTVELWDTTASPPST
jgi:hypothetical protein